MKKATAILIALCVCTALFTRCKEVKVECNYTVRTLAEEAKSQRPLLITGSAEILVFYTDAALWSVASYEDAKDGVITNEAGQTRVADLRGEPAGTGVFRFLFTQEPVMLVTYNTEYPIFGWRDANVVENLFEMNVPVVFQTWKYDSEKPGEIITKPDTVRTAGGWTMVSIPREPATP